MAAFISRREYEPFKLNGDAHFTLPVGIEPRITVAEFSNRPAQIYHAFTPDTLEIQATLRRT